MFMFAWWCVYFVSFVFLIQECGKDRVCGQWISELWNIRLFQCNYVLVFLDIIRASIASYNKSLEFAL